jgi:DivIVA domain-containing protein
MKIEAATVEAHRFGTVRRKGYDPVEVDRVMDRLVATLRSYEADTKKLQARVDEADESVDAIRRTFAAAQRTRKEMLDEGADQAARLVADAQSTAQARLAKAKAEIDAMQFERDKVVIEAHEQWFARVSDAEEQSFRIRLDAENARASTIGDRERVLQLSERAAAARLSEATEEADRIANEIVGEASREELRISARIDHLRAAITEVEIKIHDLAALATPYAEEIAEIIDLTEIDEERPLTGSGRS